MKNIYRDMFFIKNPVRVVMTVSEIDIKAIIFDKAF